MSTSQDPTDFDKDAAELRALVLQFREDFATDQKIIENLRGELQDTQATSHVQLATIEGLHNTVGTLRSFATEFLAIMEFYLPINSAMEQFEDLAAKMREPAD